jgi:starch phosphorylase
VRDHCVFTTHTPVPAGIDKFPLPLVRQVLGEEITTNLSKVDCLDNGVLNMNLLALCFSRYVNGVSIRHEEISRDMFPKYPINSITNGVHAVTWTSDPFRHLFDRYIPEWRHDNLYLRYIINVPLEEIRQAHIEAKLDLLDQVKRRVGVNLNPSVMTLGFARRITTYKRPELLFSDLERLKKISLEVGPLQVVYSGKAHPRDEDGKALIRHVFEAAKTLKDLINVVYLEDYDMALGKYLCAGVDLWLNTPQKPYEASGTSGMKAALNGVPSLSVLDGWWIEGHVEGVTGWSIGDASQTSNPSREAASLYDKLERLIIPMFYRQPTAFDAVMRFAITLNASYYNAQRMMFQYLQHAYMP